MTQKHFERLADAIWIASQTANFTDDQLDTLIGAVSLACKEANPRFDGGKFDERCRKGWKK